ncbi:hypothetical protein [Pelosinus sp. IPA-1]|uniref:hypothetical protein n=1 Tax=Pelosinus sp. IPA-1 TaxID=3029569 RepID=UPI0024362ACA|nr:hypothetical protein [Pelosinus sp. IPA-1]GMB01054.1 hypothetical protein PIPA1_38530 [Pelosinus sp. IPA-1]
MNDSFFVDTKKVAKQASGLGEFMMIECDSGNLLVTGQFVLNIMPEQFFSVRCKLEIPRLGVWYFQTKDGPMKSERQPGLKEWEDRYNFWLDNAEKKRIINTRIELGGCNLYTDGVTYKAIKQERLGMLQQADELALSGSMIVIDGMHVIAPVTDNVWKNNKWLCRLSGMDIED